MECFNLTNFFIFIFFNVVDERIHEFKYLRIKMCGKLRMYLKIHLSKMWKSTNLRVHENTDFGKSMKFGTNKIKFNYYIEYLSNIYQK